MVYDRLSSGGPNGLRHVQRERLATDKQRALEILALAERTEADPERLADVAREIPMALAVLINEDRSAALRMAGLLATFWEDTGRVEMGRKLTDQALEGQHRAATLDRDVSAAIPRALLAAAELAFRDGDKEEALKQAHATVRAAVLIEDYDTAARAKVMLSRSALREQADQRQTQAGRINPTET